MSESITMEELMKKVQEGETNLTKKKEIETMQNLLACYQVFKTILLKNISLSVGCEKCSDGYIRDRSAGFPYTTSICDCKKKVDYYKKLEEEFSSSGIKIDTLEKYSISAYKQDFLSLEKIYNLLAGNSQKPWLYLYGTPGTGKTYTAIIALMMALMAEQTVLYTNVPRLLDELRPSPEDRGKLLMLACQEVDVLVMDDIGQEKVSDWVKERLYIIINERYMANKVTIFTSNTPLQNLQEKLTHPAIISRLKGTCIPINFTSSDKRL